MNYFQNKIVLITGGASGIGKGLAIKIAQAKGIVIIWDIQSTEAKTVCKEIYNENGKSYFYKVDLTNKKEIIINANKLLKKFKCIDIIINNAGIVSGKSLLKSTDKEIDKTFSVNSLAPLWIIREFLPSMINKNTGHIVNVSSAAGIVGVAGLADYAASKFALIGFDESLRVEFKKKKINIKTTIVCPYYINTGMFDGVKTRFSFLLPILKEKYVINKIFTAIKKQKPRLIIPRFVFLAMLCRIFPITIFDWITTFFGVHDSMNNFKGRRRD